MWSDFTTFNVQENTGYGEFLHIPGAQTSVDILDDTGWSKHWVAELKWAMSSNARMKGEPYVALWPPPPTQTHTQILQGKSQAILLKFIMLYYRNTGINEINTTLPKIMNILFVLFLPLCFFLYFQTPAALWNQFCVFIPIIKWQCIHSDEELCVWK